MLALTLAALVLCHLLLKAASAISGRRSARTRRPRAALGIDTFRYKMIAVVISAGMTSIAGVFFAFYYNNLFPEQVFHISRSIELILAPIIGGIGTLFGPIIGAFLLTGLAEGICGAAEAFGLDAAGRQAGVLRHLPPDRRDGAAARHLAAARRKLGLDKPSDKPGA